MLNQKLLMYKKGLIDGVCKYSINSSGEATMSDTIDIDGAFDNIMTIERNSFSYAFYNCVGLSGEVLFPKLTKIIDSNITSSTIGAIQIYSDEGSNGLYYAFRGCTGISGVSFPELVSVGKSGMRGAFYDCTGIRSISFPKLVNVGQYGFQLAFIRGTNITSAHFPLLNEIASYGMSDCFSGCTALRSVSFPKLAKVYSSGLGGTFRGSSISSISFPSLVGGSSSFNHETFAECTSLTEIHFREDAESFITGLYYYSSNFGAPNATIYFDL